MHRWRAAASKQNVSNDISSIAAAVECAACYCSVLGQCRVTRRGIDHQPVDACPIKPTGAASVQ
jgi:hypothetical protein